MWETGSTERSAEFSLYNNFRLKNGWKVQRVVVTYSATHSRDNVDYGRWRWIDPPPAQGSDNPRLHLELTADMVLQERSRR